MSQKPYKQTTKSQLADMPNSYDTPPTLRIIYGDIDGGYNPPRTTNTIPKSEIQVVPDGYDFPSVLRMYHGDDILP